MKLYKHQKEILEKNPPKHLLAFDTGTGKTYTALKLAQKNDAACLIITPKALKEQWEEYLSEYTQRHVVVTKEEFKRDWEKLTQLSLSGVIIDEAHYFAGISSQLTKTFRAYSRVAKPNYIWLLTATPYLSTPWNVYTLAQHVGIDYGYQRWKREFFVMVRMGSRMVPMKRKNMEAKLAEYLREFATFVSIDEVVEIPDQANEIIDFQPTQHHEAAIKTITEIEHLSRWTKIHQVYNGIMLGNEYNNSQLIESDEKTDWVLSKVNKHKKVAVVARYNFQLWAYEVAIRAANPDKQVFLINGTVKNRHEVVQAIQAADDCVVLIQASCSEGYELPDIQHCVFASLSFSYKDYKQMRGRFLRINNMSETTFYHLVVKETIDEDVYKVIHNKQDFQLSLYS